MARSNVSSDIYEAAFNIELYSQRIKYLTTRGYISPENQVEIRSLIRSIVDETGQLEQFLPEGE